MGEGGDQLAETAAKPGRFVPARREDPSAVGTKRRVLNRFRVGKGGDGLAEYASQSLAFCPSLPSRSEHAGLNVA